MIRPNGHTASPTGRPIAIAPGATIFNIQTHELGRVIEVGEDECAYTATVRGQGVRRVAGWDAIAAMAVEPMLGPGDVRGVGEATADPFYRVSNVLTRVEDAIEATLDRYARPYGTTAHTIDRIRNGISEALSGLTELSGNLRREWMDGTLGNPNAERKLAESAAE